jgi:MFS family permease
MEENQVVGTDKGSTKDWSGLKLNYPKTIKVGLGFCVVMIFWTVYNFVMPLLLEQAFGFSNTIRNIIVGIGSVMSIFLLPLFGKLSDKTHTKWGRRTPYIVLGTVITIVSMIFLPWTVSSQLTASSQVRAEYYSLFATEDAIIDDVSRVDLMASWWDMAVNDEDYTFVEKSTVNAINEDSSITDKRAYFSSLYYLEYNVQISTDDDGFMGMGGNPSVYYKSVDGGENVEITETEYNSISSLQTDYTKYASYGVKQFVGLQVNSNISTTSLVLFIICLLGILLSQTIIRTPAVSLMPDITPSPLRSPGNAMISLIGGVGGAVGFLIYTVVFMFDSPTFILSSQYWVIFLGMALALVVVLALFLILVKEKKWVAEYEDICRKYDLPVSDEENEKKHVEKVSLLQKYGKEKMVSFYLILGAIFMWFLGYSAIGTNLSVYCVKVLNLTSGLASIVSGASMLVAAIGFIPVGILARKIGRKWSIILGFALAVVSYFLVGIFVRPENNPMIIFTLCYLISGFGLIFANVNTLPMVLELSSPSDVGSFTGYYYVATMSAQALGPILGGLIMDNVNNYALFFFSAICVIVGIVLMNFVKHGESPDFVEARSNKIK